MNELCRQCGRPSRRDMARSYCPVTGRPMPNAASNCRFFIEAEDRKFKKPNRRGGERENVR